MGRRMIGRMLIPLLLVSILSVVGCAPNLAPTSSLLPGEQGTSMAPTATLTYDVPLPPPTATRATVAGQGSPQPQASTAVAPRSLTKLTILHTNDSRGYVDPCG